MPNSPSSQREAFAAPSGSNHRRSAIFQNARAFGRTDLIQPEASRGGTIASPYLRNPAPVLLVRISLEGAGPPEKSKDSMLPI
jgi:hypothetical protein